MVEPEESDHYPRIDVPDLDHEQVVVEEEDSGEWDNTAQDEPGEEGIFAHDLSVAQRRHTWKRPRLHGGLRAGHDTDHVHIYVSAANANDLHPECTNPTHRWRSKPDSCTGAHVASLTFAATLSCVHYPHRQFP